MGTWVPALPLARSSVCSSHYLVFLSTWWYSTGWASTCLLLRGISLTSWRERPGERWVYLTSLQNKTKRECQHDSLLPHCRRVPAFLSTWCLTCQEQFSFLLCPWLCSNCMRAGPTPRPSITASSPSAPSALETLWQVWGSDYLIIHHTAGQVVYRKLLCCEPELLLDCSKLLS